MVITRWLSLFPLALLIFSCGNKKLPETPKSEDQTLHTQIVRGVDSLNLAGQVQVQEWGAFDCTGSLLSSRWVLTAKHCVNDSRIPTTGYSVRTGSLTRGQGTLHIATDVILNPSTDAALIKLDQPVNDMASVNYGIKEPLIRAPAIVRGWGSTVDGADSPATLLQAGVFSITSLSGTSNSSPDPSYGMQYAASPPFTGTTGPGDSGAGVMINGLVCGVHVAGRIDELSSSIGIKTDSLASWILINTGIGPSLTSDCKLRKTVNIKAMVMSGKIALGIKQPTKNAFRQKVKDLLAIRGPNIGISTNFKYVGNQTSGTMDDNAVETYGNGTIQTVGDHLMCDVGFYRPNLVMLELGTEDMEQAISVSKAPSRLDSVITKTLNYAPETTVLVATLPPAMDRTINARIQQFNSEIKTAVSRQQQAGKYVQLVDMGALTTSDLADGSNPNDTGYDKMATAFYDGITSAIEKDWIAEPVSGDRTYCRELKPRDPLPAPTVGRTNIQQPDPSVIQVGSMYYSVASDPGPDPKADYARIYVRAASTLEGLDSATPALIWSDAGVGEVWAPEIQRIDGQYYVYFSMGRGANHRMYVISSSDPLSGYGAEQKLNLPDDKWAIDGASLLFNNQRYFVWSGWEGDTNVEQNIYIAKMNSPTSPTGNRAIISQPRESWERVVGNPFINEGPEPIKDPSGQLHVVYSTNGSWSDQYCLADLRLKSGGDPMAVWDWYKSNGCLFGSNRSTLMPGWDPTLNVNGPGHHTFALQDGDINTSPPAIKNFPIMYHGVPKGMTYSWGNRTQYVGGALWWGNCTYSRQNVPGDNLNTGWSLKFFEDRNFNGGGNGGNCGPTTTPGQTSIRNADPSVIRQGGTYTSVESDGTTIFARQASTPEGLSAAGKVTLWKDTTMGEIWAPEIEYIDGRFYVYFSAGQGAAHRMYAISSAAATSGYGSAQKLALPDDRWAVDGMSFAFGGQRYFVWSGWEGTTNVEQNLYLTKMTNATTVATERVCQNAGSPFETCSNVSKRYIISQPRESWERVVGNPFINEAPEAIKDPSGQLHIVYSTNGSWSDQYCLADLRLKAGGDPTSVWDWYKSNGCLFGSNRSTLMSGWDPTLYANGPGHHSFVLVDGDIGTSPPAGPTFPMLYHAVPKSSTYSWANRMWYVGGFAWWGNTTYSRQNVPGDNANTGWGLKFFEDRNFGK